MKKKVLTAGIIVSAACIVALGVKLLRGKCRRYKSPNFCSN